MTRARMGQCVMVLRITSPWSCGKESALLCRKRRLDGSWERVSRLAGKEFVATKV